MVSKSGNRRKEASMNITDSSLFRLSRPEDDWSSELSQGRRPWGSIESSNTSASSGWGHYRLVVLPPGTTPGERRGLELSSAWFALGIPFALIAQAVVGTGLSVTGRIALAVFIYGAGVLIGLVATRKLRRGVRRLELTVIATGGRVEEFGDAQLLKASVRALKALDEGLRQGELSPVDYELGWATAYNGLPA
jgi:hypothetical protein